MFFGVELNRVDKSTQLGVRTKLILSEIEFLLNCVIVAIFNFLESHLCDACFTCLIEVFSGDQISDYCSSAL